MRRFLMAMALLIASTTAFSQQQESALSSPAKADLPVPQVEVFSGIDLNYADVNFTRLYDLLINLTPGFKVHLGHDWMIAANAWLPIINDGYNERYNMVRLNTAVASKEFHFPSVDQHFKLSAGLFSRERWGADLRWMYPVCSWLMLNVQAGVTRHWSLGFDTYGNTESDFYGHWRTTGVAGINVYLRPWNTEFRLTGGRYINEDYGCQIEAMRHFRHCTVTMYGMYHEAGNDRYSRQKEAGGFKVVMMLPPYKSKPRQFMLRPASNFRLTYIAQSDGVSMRMYNTDPEENERVLPMRLNWGTGAAFASENER